MKNRAQISFEYLLTLTFALILVVAATIVALDLGSLSQVAQAKIIEARDETISTMLG